MTVRADSPTFAEPPTPLYERTGTDFEQHDGDLDFLLSVWTRRNGRDLAREDVWEESCMRARLKREAAAQRPLLAQARSVGVSLVAAAVTAAAPAASLAHPRASAGGVSKTAGRSTLELGDRGSRVAKLQRLLGITADGVFGPKTRAAVRAFQRENGLVVDGVVGPQTWAALSSGVKAGSGGATRSDATLERGDRGARVAKLQGLLGITADGVFGAQTEAAVRGFQRRNGLVVDGVVGPQTWAALTSGAKAGGAAQSNSNSNSNSNSDSVLELGDRGARVAKLQRLLGIPADGVFGPQTRAAVRAFQARNGLTVDGKVGPATWAALTSGNAAPAPAPAPAPSGGQASGGTSANAASNGGPASVKGVDRRLWGAVALGRSMGLRLMSAHRPGSTIGGGKASDHSFYPSKAIDMGGSAANMSRYARAVAGDRGVEIVIYGPTGIWIAGIGWRPIQSSGTYRSHLDHVHVDTF